MSREIPTGLKPSQSPRAGRFCRARVLGARLGGLIREQAREFSFARGRQAVKVGGLTAIVVMLRLGAHKTLNAQDAKAVLNRGY